MHLLASSWAYSPSSTAAYASPALWDALLDSLPPASDSPVDSTLTISVEARQPRLRREHDLESLIVQVRQAGKAELDRIEADGARPVLLLPETLARQHRGILGARPTTSSANSPPCLVVSLAHLVPLSSVILFALDANSYEYASSKEADFIAAFDRNGSHALTDRVVREGSVVRHENKRWKVAMAEPVLQGEIVAQYTRVLVLPQAVDADDDGEDRSEVSSPPLGTDGTGSSARQIDTSESDDDFDIDESFLANSVLSPPASVRFGQTPLTSPLSAGSHAKTFFPLTNGVSVPEARLSEPHRSTRFMPTPISHPVSSDLLAPTPDADEDDIHRAFVSTRGLSRVGLFSGDWAVLRSEDRPDSGRLVRVFASDGVVKSDAVCDDGLVPMHLPPPLLHNVLGPDPSSTSVLSLDPAPSVSSVLPPPLPTAASVTLARIASPHSVNKTYQPLFLDGLKEHFQTRRRVVKKGDVIAVGIEESRVRFAIPSDGGMEGEEFDLPATTSNPTAVVHFLVTSLSSSPDNSLANLEPISLEEEVESGQLGCFVDPKVTKLLQSGVEKARVPDVGGWLGISEAVSFDDPTTLPAGPASHLFDFVSAALAPSASSYDLPLSVLLKGARGSGKRTMVHGVARRLGVHVLEIDAYDLIGDTDAKTEGRLQALAVDKALACAPCVLVLRNVEALARKSQALETGQEPAMTTVLRESFSTIRSSFTSASQPVIVLGTTTDVDKLPTGVLGLFKEELSIEAPGEPERLAILENLTRSRHLAPDVSLRSLAVQTAALVANDLVDLVRRANLAASERILALLSPSDPDSATTTATSQPPTRGTVSEFALDDITRAGFSLTLDDFSRALDAARSSYSESIGAPKIPNVTWDDVGGLANVKSDILDTIQLPLERPELFADGLKKRSGILLYGPPGTGKTLLAKAVATSCSLNFFSVKGPELLNMYIGESEANVRRVFQRARDAKPCVIFFDELDSVAPKRGNQGDSGGVMDRIVSQLLAELDGMSEGKGGNDVFVIGATNRPDLLDPALLRPGRFDRMLYLGISETHAAQLKIIEALTRKFKLDPAVRLDLVAEMCPFNYTGADFYALCSDAMLKAMSRKAEEIDVKIADLNSRPPYSNGQTALLTPQYYLAEMATPQEIAVLVAQQDFEAALAELIPSVSPQELSHYKQVRAKFATETLNSADKMEAKANGSKLPNGASEIDGHGSETEPEQESAEVRIRRSAAKGKAKAKE
ncbi:hypothetical protein JCM10212_004452 [Sporobolomyces blumeae]